MCETLLFIILCQPSTHWTGSRHHHGECGCSDCLCYRHLCSPASLLPPVLVIRLPMDDGDVNTTHWLLHRGGCSKISCCSTIHESVLPSPLYWQGSSTKSVWPNTLVSCALFNTLHSQNYAGIGQHDGISREKFFTYALSAAVLWCTCQPSLNTSSFFFLTGRFSDIVPGYFFEALRWVPWSFMGCFLLGSSSFC